MDENGAPPSTMREIGRNYPCPCGSGKKYKRCCGVDAAPQLGAPGGGGIPGFDPSQMDPQMMMQISQALQRLPHGQMQKLQSIMQKAMAGKDVSREAEEFEKTLPPDFKNLLGAFQMPGMGGEGMPDLAGMTPPTPQATQEAMVKEAEANMSVEQARLIIEQAVDDGKLSREQADELLKNTK